MIEGRISYDLEPASRRLGVAEEKLRRGLMATVADWLRLVIRNSFEKQATAEGAPWQPLSLRYAARKRGPGILRESGAMFEQTTRGGTIEGNTITFGSSLPYAAPHQFGFEGDVSVRGFIRRVRSRDVFGKMLGKNNKIVRGKIAFGIAHVAKGSRHMNIPARPFLPSPAFVQTEGAQVAQEFVEGALGAGNGGGGKS